MCWEDQEGARLSLSVCFCSCRNAGITCGRFFGIDAVPEIASRRNQREGHSAGRYTNTLLQTNGVATPHHRFFFLPYCTLCIFSCFSESMPSLVFWHWPLITLLIPGENSASLELLAAVVSSD